MFSFARTTRSFWTAGRRGAIARLFARDNGGVAGVETAMVLPILLLVLFGTIEFGRAMMSWNEVSHALGEAVRLVNIDSNTPTTYVKTYVENELADINTASLSVTATTTTVSSVDYMRITVSFPFNVTIPFWGGPPISMEVDTLTPIMKVH